MTSELDDYIRLAKTELELQKAQASQRAEKKNNPGVDWLGYALIAGAAIAGTAGVALTLSPQLRESVMKLLGLGGQRSTPPTPTPQTPTAIIVKEVSPTMAPSTFSRNLRPKFSFSATQYDEESLSRKSKTEAILERADGARKQTQDIAKQQESKPVKLRARFT